MSESLNWSTLQSDAAAIPPRDVVRSSEGPDPTTGHRLVSNSEIQTFLECRRKWWLAYYRKLRLRSFTGLGVANSGLRIHDALSHWYVPAGTVPVNPGDALETAIQRDWDRMVATLGQSAAEGHLTAWQKATNLERAMIEGYVQWIEESGIDADLEVIASETYLELDLSHMFDRLVKIIGRIDVRVKRSNTRYTQFLDHKTVQDLVTPTHNLSSAPQMLQYHLLERGQVDSPGFSYGAMYNLMRRVGRTRASKPPYYARHEIHHNEDQLNNYAIRLVSQIKDMLSVEDRLNKGESFMSAAYSRPNKDCHWKCEFFPVCPMFDDDSRVEHMISNYYIESDPLDYYRRGDNESE